jgi:transcriptional antiterminator
MLRFEAIQDVWKEYIKLINENESVYITLSAVRKF